MKKILIVLLSIALVLTIGAIILVNTTSLVLQPSPTPTIAPSPETANTITITQTVIYGGSREEVTQTLQLPSTETALSALQSKHSVTVKQYDFGTLVEGVDGVTNGSDNKYWLYYVNDVEASTGADVYQLKNGDRIKWEFKAYEQ